MQNRSSEPYPYGYFRRSGAASWIATSDEEHAVSILMLGPRRSNTYDSRLDSMVNVPLVAV